MRLGIIRELKNGNVKEEKFGDIATKFIESRKQYRNLIGPVGSGKDFTCYTAIMEHSEHFFESRYLVIKMEGYEQFKNYFSDYKDLRFIDDKKMVFNERLKSEIYFIDEIDNEEDLKFLLNVEITGSFVETFGKSDEYNHNIISILNNRIGRFPVRDSSSVKQQFTVYPPFIITNSYNYLALPKLNLIFDNFWQPSGNKNHAENMDNLPKGYYHDIMKNQPKYYIDLYILTDKSIDN